MVIPDEPVRSIPEEADEEDGRMKFRRSIRTSLFLWSPRAVISFNVEDFAGVNAISVIDPSELEVE